MPTQVGYAAEWSLGWLAGLIIQKSNGFDSHLRYHYIIMLKCHKCNLVLEETNFSVKRNTKRWYSYSCKTCHNKYSKEIWYKNNSDKQKESSKKWRQKNPLQYAKHRLQLTDIWTLDQDISIQECMICKMKTKLVIDHCHKTWKYRGMLCSPCNMAIWMLNENIETLKSAIDYLSTKNT